MADTDVGKRRGLTNVGLLAQRTVREPVAACAPNGSTQTSQSDLYRRSSNYETRARTDRLGEDSCPELRDNAIRGSNDCISGACIAVFGTTRFPLRFSCLRPEPSGTCWTDWILRESSSSSSGLSVFLIV